MPYGGEGVRALSGWAHSVRAHSVRKELKNETRIRGEQSETNQSLVKPYLLG
jgi:hypothetical protein